MERNAPVSWREACEAELKAHSTADAICFWQHSHESESGPVPIFDYRFEHTLGVVRLARWLSKKTGADRDTLECAAWLHDARKHFADASEKDTHAEDAASIVEGVLEPTDFPKSKIPAVRHAILHHVGLTLPEKLAPLETACLWDVDKLSKIGASSLIHFGCISGGYGPVSTLSILQKGERWLALAAGIVNSMNTEPARHEAQKRFQFLQGYYEQLRREWSDPMQETP